MTAEQAMEKLRSLGVNVDRKLNDDQIAVRTADDTAAMCYVHWCSDDDYIKAWAETVTTRRRSVTAEASP